MSECPFCNETIPADFLATLMARQAEQWDQQHGGRKPHENTMIGRR